MVTKESVLIYAKHDDPVLSKLRLGMLQVTIRKRAGVSGEEGEAQSHFFEWIEGEARELDAATFNSLAFVPGTERPRRFLVALQLEQAEDGGWEMSHIITDGQRWEGVLLEVFDTGQELKRGEIIDVLGHFK